jgi:hypothetical protein
MLDHWRLALAGADAGPFWFWFGLIAVIGAILFVVGFRRLQHARALEDLPTSRIRSAAQGYVEFHGHARLLPGPPIVAPLSSERCCWWWFEIQQSQKDSKGRSRWVTIEKKTSDELFLLDDGTGECVVDPVGAHVVPSVSRRWRGRHPRPLGYPKKTSWLDSGDFRYVERIVRYGDWLYAIGAFQTQTALRHDDETRDVSALMAQWKRDTRMLLHRFDTNRDGQIDLQEWEVARKAAIAEVRAEQVERSIQPDLHVLSAPRDGRPFILSTKTEHELTRGLRWTGIAGVAAGILLGGVFCFGLIARGLA